MAHIRKNELKNGKVSYKIQCKVKDEMTGKQVIKSTTWKKPDNMSERDARREVLRIASEFEALKRKEMKGLIAKNDDMTLSDYIDVWLKRAGNTRCDTTMMKVNSSVKRIKAFFKNVKLKDVNPVMIENYINTFYEKKKRREVARLKVGKDLREALKISGITFKEVTRNDVLSTHVYRYANSRKNITIDNAKKLCKYLKVSYNDYFDTIVYEQPYKRETIVKEKNVLSTILSAAKKQRLIEHNFASREYIEPIVGERGKVRILDESEARQLRITLENETNPRVRTALYIILLMGIRRAELAGLEWKDINLEAGTMSIVRSTIYVPGKGKITKEPKTETSKRTLTMPDMLVDILQDYKAWYMYRKEALGDNWLKSDRLMLNDEGELYDPSVFGDWLDKMLKKAGLEHVTLHSLRHTNITLQLIAGVDLKTVSARAGHARASTTTDIYSHYLMAGDKHASDTINEIFK